MKKNNFLLLILTMGLSSCSINLSNSSSEKPTMNSSIEENNKEINYNASINENSLIGIAAYYEFDNNYKSIKVTSDKYPKWFFYLWTLKHLNKFKLIAEGKTTTMGHIQRKELDNSEVKIPSKIELERMNQIMAPLLEKYILNNVENRNLESLRDSLLPKLMNGEIDLDNIEV